jgi:hypothetical protein
MLSRQCVLTFCDIWRQLSLLIVDDDRPITISSSRTWSKLFNRSVKCLFFVRWSLEMYIKTHLFLNRLLKVLNRQHKFTPLHWWSDPDKLSNTRVLRTWLDLVRECSVIFFRLVSGFNSHLFRKGKKEHSCEKFVVLVERVIVYMTNQFVKN